jgi:hypothetical protein
MARAKRTSLALLQPDRPRIDKLLPAGLDGFQAGNVQGAILSLHIHIRLVRVTDET